MRRFSFSILLLCFVFNALTAFSKPSPEVRDLSKVEKLYLTCKIWGYMKYYHPLVAKGSYNWDEKMLKVISSTENIQTYEAYSDYMAKWIYYMGQIPPCKSCNGSQSEYFDKNFDLSWTQSSFFSDELKKSLKNIERNRFQGNHFYIKEGNIGQFEPENEEPDYDLDWSNENQRLLPLFRFWNYVEYFFPHKYQTDQSWDDVLREMIPKFLAAETKLDRHLAILELVVKADDSHAGFMTSVLEEMPYYNYLPAKFEVIEDQVVITEIIDEEKARQNDLQVGDIIKTVDGTPAIDLHESHKKLIWGSNESAKDQSIYFTLFMGMTDAPLVTLDRGGMTTTDYINLYKTSDLSFSRKNIEKWSAIGDSIGYVNMGAITVADVPSMMGELMNKTVIIFDIRNSPKGTYKAVAKYLNPSDSIFARFTKPDLTYPGKFIWQGSDTCGEENEDYFMGKVILLVDAKTQNHAEYTCMCLQTAPNVVTIGSQTAGANGKVTKMRVVGRYYSAMTGMGVHYPDGGEPTQRVGIVPDIYVEPTIAGIREGRDEILDKAIEVAKEEIARKIAEAKAKLQQQLDSMRMDSIRMNSLEMDSVQMDSLQIDGN